MSHHHDPQGYPNVAYARPDDGVTRQYQDPASAPYAPAGSLTHGWLAVNDPGYVKGLVLGAALTFLLTNPKVQKAVVKGAVTLWSTVQGGVEEVKEQIQDIKAEMSQKKDEPK